MAVARRRPRLFSVVLSLAALAAVASARHVGASSSPAPGVRKVTQSQEVHFIELLWLQPKATPEGATDYFRNKLRPILAKHGGEILQSFQVAATMKGELKPAWINIIRFRSMEDMQAIFKDPEYAKLIPLRDATFDLSQQRMFNVLPVAP